MKEQLSARRQQASAKFEELLKTREQKEAEIKEIDSELNRLQGEYRLIDDLLKDKPDPATTIDATKKAKKEKE